MRRLIAWYIVWVDRVPLSSSIQTDYALVTAFTTSFLIVAT